MPITLPELTSEARDYFVSGRYVVPASKWYFGATYRKGEVDDPPQVDQTSNAESVGLLIGKYLRSTTTLEVALQSQKSKLTQPFFVGLSIQGSLQGVFNAGTLNIESTTETARVEAEHVGRLASMSYRVSGSVSTSSAEVLLQRPSFTLPSPFPSFPLTPSPSSIVVPASTTETDLGSLEVYSVGGELFPTRRIGVRVGYSRTDGDAPTVDAYDVGVSWFLRRDFALDFSVSRQSGSALGDSEGAAVRVMGRL